MGILNLISLRIISSNIFVKTAMFIRRIPEIDKYSYGYQFFNERRIKYWNDKTPIL